MNTGLPNNAMNKHLGEVMALWRAESDEMESFTLKQQKNQLARKPAEMDEPILTITWQQFQQEKQLVSAQTDEGDAPQITNTAVAAATATTPIPLASGASGIADTSLMAYDLAYPYPESHW
jgi:hypothetical protein